MDTLGISPRKEHNSFLFHQWDSERMGEVIASSKKRKEQAIAIYQPGDRVRITGPKQGITGLHAGWKKGMNAFLSMEGYVFKWTDHELTTRDGMYAVAPVAGQSPGNLHNYFGLYPASSLELFSDSQKEAPMSQAYPHGYEVGDTVEAVDDDCTYKGQQCVVTKVTEGFVEIDNRHTHSPSPAYFKLIRKGNNAMSEVTNDPVKAIMETELDADTRLLRQIGFEDNSGKVADNGRNAVLQSLYAERRADFATKYRKALATEETAAKVAAAKA